MGQIDLFKKDRELKIIYFRLKGRIVKQKCKINITGGKMHIFGLPWGWIGQNCHSINQ